MLKYEQTPRTEGGVRKTYCSEIHYVVKLINHVKLSQMIKV
ncbi:protein of unknown function [Xenorhabdus poinarii G6]|uniref:Uncharacterized protein n=1 Tax=Xenorhabdus poinarii G6 TaxID=1354304 RepID=A0A068R4C5_9GAMM|nr:protein of unknown function [Xenorhabdus poinarii G6]